jgi:hypothetical protein
MQSIRTADGGELVWQQPQALRQEYELRAGDDILATVRWQKHAGTLALAATADGRWTFKRQGFWRPRVTARAAGSDVDIATFEAAWNGGGTLALEDAEYVRWAAGNFWQSQWAWLDADGAPLVSFHNRQHLLKSGARVDLAPSAASRPDLPLLVTLGWYLLVLHAQDVAATTAVTAAAVST